MGWNLCFAGEGSWFAGSGLGYLIERVEVDLGGYEIFADVNGMLWNLNQTRGGGVLACGLW